jgi:hypothetical protein
MMEGILSNVVKATCKVSWTCEVFAREEGDKVFRWKSGSIGDRGESGRGVVGDL